MRSPVFASHDDGNQFVSIASAKLSTWSRVFFDADSGQIEEPVKRPGDGTVLLFSASNGAIVSAPSFNEHTNVFVGEAPVETLRRVLSDLEWTKSDDTSAKHQFKDGAGRPVTVSLIDVLPSRRLYVSGEKGSLAISFQGGNDLVSADLSIVSASFVKAGTQLQRSADNVEPIGDAKKRTITFDFLAPEAEGPFVLGVQIPGLETLQVILLSQARPGGG